MAPAEEEGDKEPLLARGYCEQGASLGWGQFSGVSKWVVCGTLKHTNKGWVSGEGGRRVRRGSLDGGRSWGKRCSGEARTELWRSWTSD